MIFMMRVWDLLIKCKHIDDDTAGITKEHIHAICIYYTLI